MNRNSTSTIILIVAAVLIGIIIIVYAVGAFHKGATTGDNATSTISSTTYTSFLVNPKFLLHPSTNNQATGQASDTGTTPPAPTPTNSGSTGLFGGIFSRITGTKALPAGYKQSDLSPYYKKITISSVRANNNTNSNQPSYVVLKNSGGSTVAITNWRVKSNLSGITVPQGVRVYHVTPTPLAAITLLDGENATIYTNSSPLEANFVLNKCTGYLASTYAFVPTLPTSCPRPQKSQIETFTGACQDYVLRLRTCQAGDPDVSQAVGDSSCRTYISNLNYEGCVKAHQKDVDFSAKQWRIWTGSNFLDPLHDRVVLLDQNGKLVDWYVY